MLYSRLHRFANLVGTVGFEPTMTLRFKRNRYTNSLHARNLVRQIGFEPIQPKREGYNLLISPGTS